MDIVCGRGVLYIVLYLPLYCLTNHAMLPGQMSVTFCIVIVHAYMASEIYITILNDNWNTDEIEAKDEVSEDLKVLMEDLKNTNFNSQPVSKILYFSVTYFNVFILI